MAPLKKLTTGCIFAIIQLAHMSLAMMESTLLQREVIQLRYRHISLFVAASLICICFFGCGNNEKSDISITDYNENDYAEIKMSAEEKIAFRNEYKNSNLNANSSINEEQRTAEKRNLLSRLYSGEINIDDAVEELELLQIYALESTIENLKNFQAQAAERPGAKINQNPVSVFYDAYADTWIIGGGVWWAPDALPKGANISHGETNIGGYDCLGIAIYNTNDNYLCSLLDTWLYVSSGEESDSTISRNPTGACNFSAKNGVFHFFQDYAYQTVQESFELEYSYYGKHSAVFAEYSCEFESYEGYAQLYYAHTWNDSTILSVSLNDSDTENATVSIEFSNKEHGFQMPSQEN